MHNNRKNIGNFWPVARKGSKYLAVSSHENSNSIPLVVILRDVLNLVKTRRELKKAIFDKQIKINDKEIRNANYPVGLFDVLFVGGKIFRISLGKNKKYIFEEVSGKDAKVKVIKIIGRKNLGKDKIQLNLMDGWNILSNEKVKVDDSVVFNFKDNKIEKIVKMEKGNEGFVYKGKHTGVRGKIVNIIDQGGKNIAVIDYDKEKINVWVKNVIVM